MRNVCLGLAVIVALNLAPATTILGGTPDLEVRTGSTVSVLALGGEVDIDPQFLAMAPAQDPGYSMRSLESLKLSRYETAFEEYVDLSQNQEFLVNLNPLSGAATVEFPLWVIDSDGNRIELPMTLTTGVPSTITCGGWPFCIGIPGDPAYCVGLPWDTQTGELRLVGVALIPDDSELTIECSGIVLEVEATISPADTDGDEHKDALDNCPDNFNSGQADDDGAQDDGIGNVCDNCPDVYNPTQRDNDGNGAGNSCEPLKVNFQPTGAPVPAGYLKDTGALFSQSTGRGWLGASLDSRYRNTGADLRLDTFVKSSSLQSWEATLYPAIYDVSLAVGDTVYAQGPHGVVSEQTIVINGLTTDAGENLLESVEESVVMDGRLTLEIGGAGGNSTLNFVDITESSIQPFVGRFVNFQPSGSPLPEGFEKDSGLVHDPARGYGWATDRESAMRDRGVLGDPLLDTMHRSIAAPYVWELDLPADLYDVRISIGDSMYAQGPQAVLVEGETWLDAGMTAAGEFLLLTGRVLVIDGSLTVTTGQPGGNTVMNYVAVSATPRDIDEDGVENLNDNCIDLYNPGQGDSDGDGVGDLCSADSDGDGHPDPLDNCPDVPNESQLDSDGDEYGDACDCADSNGTVFAPAVEVAILVVIDGPGAFSTLLWSTQDEESGPGTVYDLAGGTLSALHVDGGHASATCLESDRSLSQYMDQRAVPPGDGFYYLVRGDNECEPAGTYGSGGAGSRAALDSSGPCP